MLKVLQIFSNSNFIPQGHGYLWKPGLVWLHVAIASTIAFSSVSISLRLTYLLQHCFDPAFQDIFWLLCALLITNGTTHLMAVLSLWHLDYWLVDLFKAIIAGISVYIASKVVRVCKSGDPPHAPHPHSAAGRRRLAGPLGANFRGDLREYLRA